MTGADPPTVGWATNVRREVWQDVLTELVKNLAIGLVTDLGVERDMRNTGSLRLLEVIAQAVAPRPEASLDALEWLVRVVTEVEITAQP